GIDLGCQTTITTSDGDKRTLRVEETERIKNLRRRIESSVKGSNNRRKLCLKLRKACRRQKNRKDDWSNKLCHELANYQIVMQDEQVARWQESGHGKAVMDGALGRVKRRLLEREDTIVLSKWCPTTRLCTCCGEKLELSQWDRTFKCPRCGRVEDRDVHAARNMLWFYENKVGVGRTSTPDEIAAELEKIFQPSSQSSQEATESLDWW
ncbi:MAG: transposase, partial [Bacteroidales bacterium]|nr:transposase [Bacteroidales bacterium]